MADTDEIATRLMSYAKDQGGWHEIDDTCEAAADLITRQAAEIERLQWDLDVETQADHPIRARFKAAEVLLREAVEVMRWYAGDGSTYDGIDVGQRARDFLAKMETKS